VSTSFENPTPLRIPYEPTGRLTVQSLDLAAFPQIQDFEIRRVAGFVVFESPSLGRLAGFPWWSSLCQDLLQYRERTIPLGDSETPWHEVDQGWELVVWKAGDLVYVAESHEEGNGLFEAWFKVEDARYFDEWRALIAELEREREPGREPEPEPEDTDA